MAKAFGIWAPLNILVSIAWGMLLFGEFLKTGSANLAWALAAVSVIIAGVLLIIFSGGEASDKNRFSWVGLAGALGAGLGWGSYFVPIRISELSMWVAMLPMALGMFAGSCLLLVVSKSSLRLNSPCLLYTSQTIGSRDWRTAVREDDWTCCAYSRGRCSKRSLPRSGHGCRRFGVIRETGRSGKS